MRAALGEGVRRECGKEANMFVDGGEKGGLVAGGYRVAYTDGTPEPPFWQGSSKSCHEHSG